MFETDLEKIKKSFKSEPRDPAVMTRVEPADPTPEISRIKDGAIQNWTGAFINDGLQTWWAYDAERHLFLRIQAMSEATPTMNSESARNARTHPRLTRNQTMRSRGQWTLIFTAVRATPEQARKFACLTNEALTWRPDPTPVADSSDGAERLDVKSNSKSLAQVTIFGRKPCHRDYKTDTLQESFDILKNGRAPEQEVTFDYSHCDCRCSDHRAELFGRISGYLNESLLEPDSRSRQW